MLDGRIVHQHIDPTEGRARLLDLGGYLVRIRHVGGRVRCSDPELGLESATDLVDVALIAEPVQHHVHPGSGKGAGDAEADTAGRTRDDRRPAGKFFMVVREIGSNGAVVHLSLLAVPSWCGEASLLSAAPQIPAA